MIVVTFGLGLIWLKATIIAATVFLTPSESGCHHRGRDFFVINMSRDRDCRKRPEIMAWASLKQNKHLCQCGCNKYIQVKWYHYYSGIPKRISGHNFVSRGITSKDWVKEHQGKHVCKCGCGQPITISRNYLIQGIPEYKTGHQNKGRSNGMWKGGKSYINHYGYRMIYMPNHPHSEKSYIKEHILIAEQKIGRRLKQNEVVHHVNGVKTDNRPENLHVTTNSAHGRIHGNDKKYIHIINRRRTKSMKAWNLASWKKKRKDFLKNKTRCTLCKQKTPILVVHHTNDDISFEEYMNFVGATAICRSCHFKIHFNRFGCGKL